MAESDFGNGVLRAHADAAATHAAVKSAQHQLDGLGRRKNSLLRNRYSRGIFTIWIGRPVSKLTDFRSRMLVANGVIRGSCHEALRCFFCKAWIRPTDWQSFVNASDGCRQAKRAPIGALSFKHSRHSFGQLSRTRLRCVSYAFLFRRKIGTRPMIPVPRSASELGSGVVVVVTIALMEIGSSAATLMPRFTSSKIRL